LGRRKEREAPSSVGAGPFQPNRSCATALASVLLAYYVWHWRID